MVVSRLICRNKLWKCTETALELSPASKQPEDPVMLKSSKTLSLCRRDILDIYKHAVDAVKPEHLIKRALKIEDDHLIIRNVLNERTRVDISKSRVHVIGGGKSVLGMACGLAQLARDNQINQSFTRGVLSLPIGLKGTRSEDQQNIDTLLSIGVERLYGSRNNLPDKDSAIATSKLLDNVRIACQEDRVHGLKPLFIVLISGGGSACLTQPKHIDLGTKLELIRILVQRGASIIELNAVRRYFSSIKGGNLAKHILRCHDEAQIVTLIISDVIDDPIEFIASGPTHLTSHKAIREDFLLVLDKYQIASKGYLYSERVDLDDELDRARSVANIVIGNNSVAIEAAKQRAINLGYSIQDLGIRLEGSSDSICELLRSSIEQLCSQGNNKILVIGGGEATVTRHPSESWGLGGRVQEMALDYMISTLTRSPQEHLFDMLLAGTTDGQDGPTDVAACLASYSEWCELVSQNNHDLDLLKAAKKSHDSYNFWTKYRPSWLIKTGMTGTNVMDIYMCLIMKDEVYPKL